ncbi:MAG: hypothetical protein ABJG86_20250 [Nitratireductor sp.]|jgi:hypothetical protein
MNRQPHTSAREIIVADAIREVVSELRLVDVADYVAYIRLEYFANLADIVESAAELYFMPDTLRFGHGGDVDLGWSGEPTVNLDLQLRPKGATVYFTLNMTALKAGVEIGYVALDDPSPDPMENTRFLANALDASKIRRTAPLNI